VAEVGAALGGTLLILVALARHRDRWWLEHLLMRRRHRQRQRGKAVAPHGADPRLAALRGLAPGLVVEEVSGADGARVGVARDDSGWYAVAAVTGSSAPMRNDVSDLPLDALTAALATAGQPGAALQVVTQTVPAPSLDIDLESPVGRSYRQLLAGLGESPVPAGRETWIAVRVDARSLAEAVVDHPVDLEVVPAVVAAQLRQVTRPLSRVGISHRLLDAEELLEALARSCDLEPPALDPAPLQPREDWSEWHSGRLAHRSFWIRGWPPLEQSAALLDGLSTAPAAMTSVALILVPDGDAEAIDLRGLVRVGAPVGELADVCDSIVRGARQAHADLFQLDGEQGPAVYASAPTGGGGL
jgi:type VII secretion protein EccE